MRLTVKLHVVTKPEIDQVFAGASSDVRARALEASQRVFVVQTRLETQPAPIFRVSIETRVQQAQSDLPPIQGRKELAAFFHEQLPQSHEEGPGVAGTISAWGRDVANHPLANALTLGAWSALNGPSATSTTVEPTEDDYRRATPISAGFFGAFPAGRRGFCSNEPGKPCDSTFIYERPKDEGHAPITLRLGMHAEVLDEGGVFTSSRICEALHSVDVELPTGGTIEERFAAELGERAHLISELDRPKKSALPVKQGP